jgi:subtilisin-like proprotein convertase family protein
MLGAVIALFAAATAAGSSAAPPLGLVGPPNDELASALVIGFQPYTNVQSNVQGTTSVGETTVYTGCQGEWAGETTVGATVWYRYTHSGATVTLQLDTIATSVDSVAAVYTGPASSPTYAGLTLVACGDQEFNENHAGMTFSAVDGQTYYIQAGGYFGQQGTIVVNLSPIISTAGATFEVTTNTDTGDATPDGFCDNGAGQCTFREAIQEANAIAGTDNIFFNTALGPDTINSTASYLINTAVIDARTQFGFTGAPRVTLNGTAVALGALSPAFGASSIRGLVIHSFGGTAISPGSGGNVIQGNYIGTSSDGLTDMGNGNGVYAAAASNVVIGGTTVAARNIISGNFRGVFLDGNGGPANNNKVMGNYIGTDVTGTADLGNGAFGVAITGDNSATGNIVGGALSGSLNVISGNGEDGLLIDGANATLNTVAGNHIGTNAAGNAAIPNAEHGIQVDHGADTNTIGGTVAAARNVISGNPAGGVLIQGAATTANLVQGNYIGTDAAGNADLGNGGVGVHLQGVSGNRVGDATATPGTAPGNVVSGNLFGIVLNGPASGNEVWGNIVGLNAAGNADLGNDDVGIWLDAGANGNTVGGTASNRRNVSSGNARGIAIFALGTNGNTVQGNYVGTDVTGSTDIANSNGIDIGYGAALNTVGGTTAGAGNLLSGNSNHGLSIGEGFASNSNTVQGNYVGTTASGAGTLGNNGHGIHVFSGSSLNVIGPGNVVSSNVLHGIKLENVGANFVKGNFIGTNAAGTAAVANGSDGVNIASSSGILIGGSSPADRNIISGNIGNGVSIQNSGGAGAYPSIDVPKTVGSSPTSVSSVINVAGTGRVADVNVTMNITHTWDEDLVITLTPPGGSPITLAAGLGGSGDNFATTTFDDETTTSIVAGFPPFNGTFRPQSPLSQADIGDAGGTWTLTLTDTFPAEDHGTLNSWSLGLTTVSNQIAGNYIGTDASGTTAIANGVGVLVDQSAGTRIGGTSVGAGNLISGNSTVGVYMRGSSTAATRVERNLIGTQANGSTGLGNGGGGVVIEGTPGNTVGGTTSAARNVISANGNDGILIGHAAAVFNTVSGNYIGTNSTGTADLGNNGNGVVQIISTANNLIGGTTGTTPGGSCTGACNLISGNNQFGLQNGVGTGPTTIQGNFIGTNATGTAAIGNSIGGVYMFDSANNLIGGSVPGARNLISGNPTGVGLGYAANQVRGNFIGTRTDGITPLGNGIGVSLHGAGGGSVVGGPSPGDANTIAFNTNAGIAVNSTGGNPLNTQFQGNSMFANGGLGIDLNQDGITINDSGDGDVGPNQLQNYPVLFSSSVGGGTTTISGALNSSANTQFRIEFFQSYECDPSGLGEGQISLGETDVLTDGAGNVFYGPALAGEAGLGSFITATATGPSGTSEWSNCIPAVDDLDDDNDGYADLAEGGTPLCAGTANDDGSPVNDDTAINDGCPAVNAAEAGMQCTNAIDDDADGAMNDGCPIAGGFSEAQFRIGTRITDPCGLDGWPSNVFNGGPSSNKLQIQDVTSFVVPVRHLDKNPNEAGFDSRWDLVPGRGILGKFININDLLALVNGTTGNPPMFNNTRAFDKTCPFPP